MNDLPLSDLSERWARFRFAVVGPLLASPPSQGQLQSKLKELSKRSFKHPVTGIEVRFGLSTIQRWYYLAATHDDDPVAALRKKVRRDRGRQNLSPSLAQELRDQYAAHPRWSYQLHYDNAQALVRQQPRLGPLPSYTTLRRFMKAQGLVKHRRLPKERHDQNSEQPKNFERREIRSYENEFVNGLWHLDFHHCSRRVLNSRGAWVKPLLFGVLDDHSRLCCHLQWYLDETAEALVHGLSQAFLKRGLPRALLTDNGSAMEAEETREGLLRLGILQEFTLPYSPHQNGKQEVFWAQVEGRLMSLLENERDLTLDTLNKATTIWAESEYNRKVHRETAATPLERFTTSHNVGRDSLSLESLREAFTIKRHRKPRHSDGTVSVEGQRFELPNAWRWRPTVAIRYPRWDLSRVALVNEENNALLAWLLPLDKARNAEGRRRVIENELIDQKPVSNSRPPLLEKLLNDFDATGLQPPYLPQVELHKQPKDDQ